VSVNVTIEGRLGQDPELRFTKSGKSVASISLVSSKPVKGDNGNWEDTEVTWYTVDAWEELGENAVESLRKGHNVIVFGRLYSEKFTTKDGRELTGLRVRAYNIAASLKKDKWQHAGKSGKAVAPAAVQDNPWSDDIPPF
jgi:single-strand DNA-binding protein